MRDQLFIPVLTCVLALGCVAADAAEQHIARYSVLEHPSELIERDPLATSVDRAPPVSVTRIGEAIDWLLAPSGYRLSSLETAAPGRAALLALPLPESQRTLAHLPLRAALQVLAGPAFRLVEDPVHRLVSFEPCASVDEAH